MSLREGLHVPSHIGNPFRKAMAGPCPQGPASPFMRRNGHWRISSDATLASVPSMRQPNNLLSIMELLSDIVYWALYAFFFGGCILILGAQLIRDTIELARDFHDVNREGTDEEEQV